MGHIFLLCKTRFHHCKTRLHKHHKKSSKQGPYNIDCNLIMPISIANSIYCSYNFIERSIFCCSDCVNSQIFNRTCCSSRGILCK